MKKSRLAAGALALMVSVSACGCSRIYEMTEEEESAIVFYSAHAVSKFNKRQPDGVKDVVELEKQLKKEEEERQRKKEAKELPSGVTEDEAGKYVSLSQALQLESPLEAVYKKYEIASDYQSGGSYLITANSGNELLILHVDLKNTGSRKASCDIFSKGPSFRLLVNGDIGANADMTILLNDLGTYQGKIKAKSTEDTVLVFQVPKGSVKKINSMELEVSIGGGASLARLK